MLASMSPQRENNDPQGDNLRMSTDYKKITQVFASSPKLVQSPPQLGKKLNDSKAVQLEMSSVDHADERPRFPIRIPIDQMKPKKNYLQGRKSEATIDDKLAKAFKSDRYIKNGSRPASQASNTKSSKGKENSKKRVQTTLNNNSQSDSITSAKYSLTEPKELRKVVDRMVENKVKQLVNSSQSIEVNKTSIDASLNKTIKNRSHSTRRPASSRSSNKTLKKNEDVRRSSHFEKRDKESSRLSQMLQQEFFKTEESRKELEKRTKQIIEENLRKYNEQIKLEEEKMRKVKEEKELERQKIAQRNIEIKEKNKLRVSSGSPIKHKYGWGADQQRLEMKPQSKESGKKWEKKESPKRREELGLGYLNKLDEDVVKKVKADLKTNFEKTAKESEEKYNNKTKRNEVSPDKREKLKSLVHEQFVKKEKEKKEQGKLKKIEDLKKKQRLEALLRNVEKIRLEDQAAKIEEESKRASKPKKKKARKPFQVSDQNIPSHSVEEDSQEKDTRKQSQDEVEEEYIEEEHYEKRELNKQELKYIRDVFVALEEKVELELLRGAFTQIRAFASHPSRAKKVTAKSKEATPKKDVIENKIAKDRKTPEQKIEKSAQKNVASESQRKIKANFVEEYEVETEKRASANKKPLKEISSNNKPTPQKVEFEQVKRSSGNSFKKDKQLEFEGIEDFEGEVEEYLGGNARGRSLEKQKKQKLVPYDEGEYIEIEERYGRGKNVGGKNTEGKDFDDLLFNLSSEELIRLPYFSIAK